MKITNFSNGKKIIAYSPIVNNKYKTVDTVYEFSKNRRLEVNTVFDGSKKHVQDKTLTQNGKILKEIVIEFINGIRNKIIRVR